MKDFKLVQKINSDDLVVILQSWRLWLVGAMVGAVFGGLIFRFTSPAYQAEAIVSIDHNLEQAWQFPMDREAYIYLNRESNKIRLVAWGDSTLTPILTSYPNFSKEILKNEYLSLDTSQDGGWYFYVKSDSPEEAVEIVNLWTSKFIENIKLSIDSSTEIENARDVLIKSVIESPDISYLDISRQMNIIFDLHNEFSGISPFIEINLIQLGEINKSSTFPKASFLLIGSIFGSLISMFIALFQLGKHENN